MPTLQVPDGEIYYEVHGSGYPLMILAAGGSALGTRILAAQPVGSVGTGRLDGPDGRARQQIPGRRDGSAQCRPLTHADQCDRRLHTYAGDHLVLADHLGLDRFHVMGGGIGVSFCLPLCELAPNRITAAILQNPIGHAAAYSCANAGRRCASWPGNDPPHPRVIGEEIAELAPNVRYCGN